MTAALLSAVANRGIYGYKTFSSSTTGSGTRLSLGSFSGGSTNTPAGSRVFYVTVANGIACWGQGYSSSGIYTGLSFASATFAAGDIIFILNSGYITGAGGEGATGSNNGGGGYAAIDLSALPAGVIVQITNNGWIAGGGGGGGGTLTNNVYGGGGAGAGGIAYFSSPGASAWDSVGTTPGVTSPPVGGSGGTQPSGAGAASVVRVLSGPNTAATLIGVGGGGGGSGGGYLTSGPTGAAITAGTGAGGGPGVAGSQGYVQSMGSGATYFLGGGGGGWGAQGGNGLASSGSVGQGGAPGRAISFTSATVLLTNNGTIYGSY